MDGLLLCEGHALEAKLEGQLSCWGEVLFHAELWSREAGRRGRADVARLLEDGRREAACAMRRARLDLDAARRGRKRRRGPPPQTGPPR